MVLGLMSCLIASLAIVTCYPLCFGSIIDRPYHDATLAYVEKGSQGRVFMLRPIAETRQREARKSIQNASYRALERAVETVERAQSQR